MLAFSTSIKDIESRANSCSKFANSCYLTHTQLAAKVSKLRDQRDRLCMSRLSNSRKLTTLAKNVDLYKRLLLCLNENDIPRLRQVLHIMPA